MMANDIIKAMLPCVNRDDLDGVASRYRAEIAAIKDSDPPSYLYLREVYKYMRWLFTDAERLSKFRKRFSDDLDHKSPSPATCKVDE
jgi:hypothetical protein